MGREGEMKTTDGDGARYARQICLPEIGAEGQERLRRGRVLIVGVGGLGTPAALYLAAAGVGTLGLVDPDAVELSNLHRQILYDGGNTGRAKVAAAAAAIRARNPEVRAEEYAEALTAERLPDIFAGFDFVIDGTDRASTKFLINDGAVRAGTPYSHAGAVGWVGQTMTVLPGRSACYRCLFPEPPEDDDAPACQVAGIVGAVVGAIGIVQATEALKYLLGLGDLLTDRMATYDALALRWRVIPIPRRRTCPACREAPRPRDAAECAA